MSISLYKREGTSTIVAAYLFNNSATVFCWDEERELYHVRVIDTRYFTEHYIPLSTAPCITLGSTSWAIAMLEDGHKVRCAHWRQGEYLYVKDRKLMRWYVDVSPQEVELTGEDIMELFHDDWELCDNLTSIVLKLPHEFEVNERVLVRSRKNNDFSWERCLFERYNHGEDDCFEMALRSLHGGAGFTHCVPYAGNEHLEGEITDDTYGTAPEGYAPPYIPMLGDDDYWQIDDQVCNIATGHSGRVAGVDKETRTVCIFLWNREDKEITILDTGREIKNGIRCWFHSGTTVDETGHIDVHVPTRPATINGKPV